MSIRIYPVTETELCADDYEVKINGIPVKPDTARVSAQPFNRRWPGHQRGKEQTELVNFVSFAADEAVSFEIMPKRAFERVVIRPSSLGIQPAVTENGTITFTLQKPAYFTVEPYGRNKALHIFADPIHSYGIDRNDPNMVYFGAGIHDAGMITLKSNQTLFLDEGAVVYGCVKAVDAENIRILGNGILDNSRNKAEILYEYNAENHDTAIKNANRIHTVQLEYCVNVEINGITIRDSLVYNIRPIGCRQLHISNVKLIGCWRYNSDGIDMHNCEDVLIENCFLRTFDDSICIKGFDCYYEGDVEQAVHDAMYRNGKAYEAFRNICVRNCTIWNDWGKCLEIGAETRATEICAVVFEDCDIIHVTGSPIDIYNIDYADVHDVLYQNIRVEYDDVIPAPAIQARDQDKYSNTDTGFSPHLICAVTAYHHEYSAGGTRRGMIRDVTVRNIHLFGRHMPKANFAGYDEDHQTKDILMENIFWNGKLLTGFDEGCLTLGGYTENIRYRRYPTLL